MEQFTACFTDWEDPHEDNARQDLHEMLVIALRAMLLGCRLPLAARPSGNRKKSNEFTVVPRLLEMISLQGAIVTADALSCHRIIVAKVVEKGGDYVLALKGNQGTLFEDVRLYLDDEPAIARSGIVGGRESRARINRAPTLGPHPSTARAKPSHPLTPTV